jgi:Family of unknown function (DUF5681)
MRSPTKSPLKRRHAHKHSRAAIGHQNHPSDNEYRIGPGRPPREHQFKPGQSGSPKGRKRKPQSLIPDLKEIYKRAFNQEITVAQGEREQVLTMWDAGMQQLSIQFAKGDRHARRDLFWIAERLGNDLLMPTKANNETLAPDHQAILDDYVTRRTQRNAPSAPVFAPAELVDDDESES